MSFLARLFRARPTWLRWAGRGFWAVVDQGLFSGANFLVNILLARWLEPKEYGAFAVALSVFYLLAGFHTAVLTEPMMVFGAGKYREQFRKYLGMLLYGHWVISALIALGLGIAAFVMRSLGSQAMAQALAGLALASPFLLLLWLTRRGCYAEMRPQWAALGSSINMVVVLVGLFFLWRAGVLSTLSGLVLLGAAAVMASLLLMTLHLRPRLLGFTGNPTLAMVKSDHIAYGRWALGATVLMWVPGNIVYYFLPLWSGLEGAAIVRALMNFIFPILQAISALSLLILPYFSKLVSYHRLTQLRKSVVWFVIMFVSVDLAYAFGIITFRHELLNFVYGQRYEAAAGLIPIAALLSIAATLNAVFGGVLRTMGMLKFVFLSYVGTAFMALTVGVILIAYFGAPGAVWSMVLATFTTSFGLMWFFWRNVKHYLNIVKEE